MWWRTLSARTVNFASRWSFSGADSVQFCDQHFGHVVFLVRLVHDVFSDMGAHGGIKDLFFENGVNLEVGQGLVDDLCFPGGCFRLLELIEKGFNGIVILLQDRDRGGLRVTSSRTSSYPPSAGI